MNKILTIVGLCAMSLVAQAGEKIDRTLEADSQSYVKIEHVSGYAKVSTWDKDEVRVVGELGERSDEFKFDRRGQQIRIEVEVKSHRGWFGGGHDNDDGDHLEIFIPVGSKVDYESTNADFTGSGFSGGANIETVNGDIEVTDLKGRIHLESVNGHIKTAGLQGHVSIETVNGDIRDENSRGEKIIYNSVNGDIRATSDNREIASETVNGEIELHLSQVSDLELSTVNGRIDVRVNLVPGGEIRASSVGGTIDLKFKDKVSARFDIESFAGGSIKNRLTDDEMRRHKYGPSRWLEFVTNGGEGSVKISTVSGRISLAKE